MSRTRGKEVAYRCFNDCRQTGCPGHTIRVGYYNTMDLVEVWRDEDKEPDLFDPNEFRAMIRSWKEME